MKKSKSILLMIGLLIITIISVQAMTYMPDEGNEPDKACILDSNTPEHSRLFCYGEGSYCTILADCLWLIIPEID